MNLKSIAQSALASIATAIPDCTITVVYGSQTATGIIRTKESNIADGLRGDAGMTVSAVYVNADSIDKPKHGDRITVGGSVVYVLGSSVDPASALRKIEYSETQPATDQELF